jgi:hypothetical protein
LSEPSVGALIGFGERIRSINEDEAELLVLSFMTVAELDRGALARN